jgi:hypothetical protein
LKTTGVNLKILINVTLKLSQSYTELIKDVKLVTERKKKLTTDLINTEDNNKLHVNDDGSLLEMNNENDIIFNEKSKARFKSIVKIIKNVNDIQSIMTQLNTSVYEQKETLNHIDCDLEKTDNKDKKNKKITILIRVVY